MLNDFYPGDKVLTPGGVGTIVYRRMAAPDYTEVYVYSVRLESRAADINYTGTIYPAKEVSKSIERKS